jgi:chromosome partitioning protein
MTLCVIDTAPHAVPEATRIARVCDLIIVPVRPSAFDLAALDNVVRIVRAAKAKAAFVISAAPFRAPEIGEARTVLARFEMPIAPVTITDRCAFARAVITGRAVTEFEPDGKAAEEVTALWQWIKETMA